jgi:hypothetical protein
MKDMTQTIKQLVVGIVLAFSLTSALYGQVPPLPDPGTNNPPAGTNPTLRIGGGDLA